MLYLNHRKRDENMAFKVCISEPFPHCEKVYPTQQKKIRELLDYLTKDSDVQSITLFGSSITPQCHIDSDVDLYVELKKNKKLIHRYFDFVFDIWTNYTADQRLKEEIEKKGIKLYEQ